MRYQLRGPLKTNPALAGTKGSMNTLTETNVRLFASAKSWIEGEALRQLYATSKLEGMRLAVGCPDLHPGKGSAIGAVLKGK